MTVQPTRDQLREAAEGHLRFGGGGDDLANGVLALLDQLDQAEARIKAVRDVHWADKVLSSHVCAEDGHDWPCPTIRALDGEA